MKVDLRFFKLLFWEVVENAPMLISFLLAIRIQSNSFPLAFVVLIIGMVCGTVLIHFTESKKYSNQPTLKETIVNFIVFTLVSTPFVIYFSNNNAWWSNLITDTILGVIAGFALSFGESWGWSNTETVKVHAVSMAVAFVLLLYGIRLTYELEPISAIFLVAVVLNIFVSVVIVLFDYYPIKEPNEINTSAPDKPDH
jgi:hypothetical protein